MFNDWFAERNNVWFGLGDAGAAPYCQCEAAISADSNEGEAQAFLFRTFGSNGTTGWFMVLSHNNLYHPDRSTQVEWIHDCQGLLHGVTRLADFVATLKPDLADAGCPGLAPSDALIADMVAYEHGTGWPERDALAAIIRTATIELAEPDPAAEDPCWEWTTACPVPLTDEQAALIARVVSGVDAEGET